MKKKVIFFLFAATLAAMNTISAQITLDARIGANFSSTNLKFLDGSKASGSKLVPGFNAGINVEAPVWNGIYIQPGLLFTTKGTKLTKDAYYWFGQIDNDKNYLKFNNYYVELPLNIIYKYQLGKNKIFGGAGPYATYAIGGKWKHVNDGIVETGKTKFYKNYDDMPKDENHLNYGRKLDIGLNALVGYELTEKLSAQINGQFGLRNLIQVNAGGQVNDAKMKTIGADISIGYRF